MVLWIHNKEWKNWEQQALALTICFGAFSFVAQGKGFAYHLYPFLAFLLLWVAMQFTRAMKHRGWQQVAGAAAVAVLLGMIPGYCLAIAWEKPQPVLMDNLEQDLTRLGGPNLQGQVQCMDMVSGCLGALFHLNLVQYSGFIGDYMFFGPPGSKPNEYYRDKFLNEVHSGAPEVIVVTTARLGTDYSFQKIDQWPAFSTLLDHSYTLEVTRMTAPQSPIGYRIYLLNQRRSDDFAVHDRAVAK
jgi:hypothetical protein